MKKVFVLIMAIVAVSSCALTRAGIQTAEVKSPVVSTTITTLVVAAEPVTFIYSPSKAEAKALSLRELEANALYLALQEFGGDEMVKVSYYVDGKTRLFWRLRGPKIKSISVTGYPATYTEFREPTAEDRLNIESVYGTGSNTVVKFSKE